MVTFTVVPLLTERPRTNGEVAPEPDSVCITLPPAFTIAPAVTARPVTVELAPVEERVLIVLLLIFMVVTVVAPPVIPVTLPPVPFDISDVTVLFEYVWTPWLLVPCVRPVMAPLPVILVIILPVQTVALPKLTANAVIALLPPVILENVFPVMVLVGPLEEEAPSVLLHPAMAVAPVTVTFEKLLPVWVMAEPFTEEELAP